MSVMGVWACLAPQGSGDGSAVLSPEQFAQQPGSEEGNKTVKGPVVLEEQHLLSQQRFASPSMDGVE